MSDNAPQNDDLDEDFWKLDDAPTAAGTPAAQNPAAPAPVKSAPTSFNSVPAPEPTPAPQPSRASAKSPSTLLERFTLPLTLVFVICLALGLCLYASKHFEILTKPSYASNLPKTGKFTAMSAIETGWKKYEDSQAEEGYQLRPSVTLTLGDCPQPTGTLRIVFYSTELDAPGNPRAVGDTATVKYQDGHFENGKKQITVTGTASIGIMADFLTYRDQDDVRWIVEIRESDGASDFEVLGHAPIDPVIIK